MLLRWLMGTCVKIDASLLICDLKKPHNLLYARPVQKMQLVHLCLVKEQL